MGEFLDKIKAKVVKDQAEAKLKRDIISGFEKQHLKFIKFNKREKYFGDIIKGDRPKIILRKKEKAPEKGQILVASDGSLIKIRDKIKEEFLKVKVEGIDYDVLCTIFSINILEDNGIIQQKKEQIILNEEPKLSEEIESENEK